MKPDSSNDLETLIAELLLQEEKLPLQEQFAAFLTMEPFVKMLREEGFDNQDILRLCKRVDQGDINGLERENSKERRESES